MCWEAINAACGRIYKYGFKKNMQNTSSSIRSAWMQWNCRWGCVFNDMPHEKLGKKQNWQEKWCLQLGNLWVQGIIFPLRHCCVENRRDFRGSRKQDGRKERTMQCKTTRKGSSKDTANREKIFASLQRFLIKNMEIAKARSQAFCDLTSQVPQPT